MFEELTPPTKTAKHGTVGRYFFIVVSFILSFGFSMLLIIGSVFYFMYQKITGKEKKIEPSRDTTPYADIKNMKATGDLRYYALHLDLDLQEYKVTTEDGYILTLHRLIDPKDTELDRQSKKPVLLQHGLLSSSGSYLSLGRNSLAYHIQQAGYDVWMGNNRSWFEAQHAYYEGNLMHNEEYWDWDVRELAYYDLPCIIDNILAHKPNHSKLALVGHSQGCTQTYLMLKNSNLKEHHKKVEMFFQLAPAIFPGPLFHQRAFIKFMHHLSKTGFLLFFGCCSFLRNITRSHHMLKTTTFYLKLSYFMFKFLFGWSGHKWNKNKKVWKFHFIFNVSFVSSKLMSWWLSEWVGEGFSNQLQSKESYVTGENLNFTPVNSADEVVEEKKAIIQDSKTYFPYKTQWFGLEEDSVVVPMVVFSTLSDILVDCKRLSTHLRHYEREVYTEGVNLDIIDLEDYDHVDVVYAEKLIEDIGVKIVDKLNRIESGASTEPKIVSDENETDATKEAQ